MVGYQSISHTFVLPTLEYRLVIKWILSAKALLLPYNFSLYLLQIHSGYLQSSHLMQLCGICKGNFMPAALPLGKGGPCGAISQFGTLSSTACAAESLPHTSGSILKDQTGLSSYYYVFIANLKLNINSAYTHMSYNKQSLGTDSRLHYRL